MQADVAKAGEVCVVIHWDFTHMIGYLELSLAGWGNGQGRFRLQGMWSARLMASGRCHRELESITLLVHSTVLSSH